MRPLKKILDLQALRNNIGQITRLSAGAEVIGVVKADAYGHGAANLLPALADIPRLAVASVDEALQLRRLGAQQPIMLLEGLFRAEEALLCLRERFEPCIHQAEQLPWLINSNMQAWIKIDSGMHRLGFDAHTQAWRQALAVPGVRWQGVVSHFACADAEDKADARQQLAAMTALELSPGWRRCLANSAALFALPEARADAVRPGLALYGMSPFARYSAQALGLTPVMCLQTEVLAVHTVQAGTAVGYSRGFSAPTAGQIAVIALGYGDGFPRAIDSGAVHLYLNGKHYPLVGNIAMDMALLWLGRDKAAVGDTVIVWGRENPAETVAAQAKTIPYTLTTMLTARVSAEVRNG